VGEEVAAIHVKEAGFRTQARSLDELDMRIREAIDGRSRYNGRAIVRDVMKLVEADGWRHVRTTEATVITSIRRNRTL
jgi:hypothetical protein